MPSKKQPLKHTASLSKERYINREMSWLAFNSRVLAEAENSANPLLERVNYLAISASNLDEFYMVRVAGLKDMIREGVAGNSVDGLRPTQEIAMIADVTRNIVLQQNMCWKNLQAALKKEGFSVCHADNLTTKEENWLATYFLDNVFPALTPIAIDPAHPFPFLPNLSLALAYAIVPEHSKHERIAIVSLPASLPRFIQLPGKHLRVVPLEDVITLFLDALFPKYTLKEQALFRIVRDSELEVEDDAEDFVRRFEAAVKERRKGRVIRLRFSGPASPKLVQFVAEQLHVEPEDVLEFDGMIGMRSLTELVAMGPAHLKYPPFTARFPERINDYGGDCFAAIAAKDIIIHHPFETFDVVVKFIEQATRDANVVSIKQTLYRTSKDSPIVKALIAAADAGKAVTALIELKARFDEEANINFARDMERAGVQVSFGFTTLKTHAKVTLVTRREEGQLKSYAHFGTGNYHPSTARLYTDLSFFTCDTALTKDAAYLFNFLTGYAAPRKFSKLIVAPKHMRSGLESLIRHEIENAKAGKPAAIWAKMNALVDPQIIDLLYEASQAGVHVDLVVRGICCLRPNVKGLSENIRVKSIVGRFLEHARVYCFANGHLMPSPHAKVFIGSADWMPRNLDGRVEIMVPIENPTVHEQVLGQIMLANLKDERGSWVMDETGHYTHIHAGENALSAHEYFMKNPSLSGRGKALKKGMKGG
jgi:polyphosphate kinase